MLLASNPLSSAAQPLFNAFAQVLAFFYSLVPNYAVAIAMLTVAVMIVVFPITRRGTRSMMRMQIYQPELKKLTQRYKAPPGATPAEKAALRQQQQEEMMAFYKENNISPTGGCLPMLIQLPIFWILYGTIRGLVHTTITVYHGHKVAVADPLYIKHTSSLYQAIMHENPVWAVAKYGVRLEALGINLADSVRTGGLSWAAKLPFIALILVAVGLQYVQMKQLSGRNPAAQQANPQMAQMQKIFPIVFAVIYIAIPAGVNVYFIVSSLFRIGQQEYMYRRDPQLRESLHQLRERHAKAAAPGGGGSGGKAGPAAKPGKPARPNGAAPGGERPRGLLGRLGVASALAAGGNAGAGDGNGSGSREPRGGAPARGADAPPAGERARSDATPAPSTSGNGRPAGGSPTQATSSPGAKVPGSPLSRQRPAPAGGAGQQKARQPSRAQGKRARRPR
jgi:YidC/Oxa1 family membrane protein insertase